MSTALQGVFVLLLTGIVTTGIVGWRRDNVPAVVNAILSVTLALVPTAIGLWIRTQTGVEAGFDHSLSVWIATAGFLHMLGMLGWYDTVWWWDHLTHAISATIIAAFVYASLLSVDTHVAGVQLSSAYVAVATVTFTLAIGVFWEFLELAAREIGERIDRPPVLRYYGFKDTVFDMLFNGVGAVLVVAFDLRVFVSITDRHPAFVGEVLVGAGVSVFVGSIVLGILLEVSRRRVHAPAKRN
ncbi:MAG: hypothetical protein ACQETB_01290 [Halobacteriota archaeon]